MPILSENVTAWIKRNRVAIILLILLAINLASVAWMVPDGEKTKPDFIPALSEIDGPRIDSGAAMIVVDEEVSCLDLLPREAWVFLLVAYMALLVFNLSYRFREAARAQWFWEVLYTVLFLLMWLAWDGCRTQAWFPFSLVQTGLLTYTLYLFLVERKLKEA